MTLARHTRMGRGKGLRSGDTAARKRHRARLAAARAQRGPTYRELEKELNGLTATAVKLRDGHRCLQCWDDGVELCDVIDAGHIYPRSEFPYFKFEPDNIVGQCRLHNKLHIRRPDVMLCWYQQHFSEEALAALHERAVNATRPTRDDLLRMIDERKAEIATYELTRAA